MLRLEWPLLTRIVLTGIGVSMSRSCVVNAIFFSAFEYTKKRINRLEYDEELLRTHGRA